MELSKLRVLDCTIRDGGYLNNWFFEDVFVRELVLALSKAGIDMIEIGWRGTEKYFEKEKYGTWRYSFEEDLARISKGIRLPKLALMVNIGKIDEDDFCPKSESLVDLVRVVSDRVKVPMALEMIEKIRKKGYQVSLNATGFSNYSDAQLKELVKRLEDVRPDYIFTADTYGSMLPDDIPRLLEPLIAISGDVKVGFHPHNSLQMAFANTLEAIRVGVDCVDASVFGMGRGAGNLPMEVILSYLQERRKDKYNVIPVLNFLDLFMAPLHKKIGWGYTLPYFMSGIFKCHPYFVRDIMNYKRFTVDEIWSILDVVKKKNPSTYSTGIIDRIIQSHHIGWIDKAMADEMLSSTSEPETSETTVKGNVASGEKIPYAGRHKNRDFLILANGPNLKAYKNEIDNFIEKYDPIVMGANNLGGLFRPDYHCFTLTKRLIKYINSVSEKSHVLLSQHIPEETIRRFCFRDYEIIYYNNVLKSEFKNENNILSTNCRTVSVLLLGIAIVMGANRIFAAGMDGYIGTKSSDGSYFFYNEEDDVEDEALIVERHKWSYYYISAINQYLIELGKEELSILTPTSYSMFYNGIENFI